MELSVVNCPFDYNYDTWHHLATESWVNKALWEKIDTMGIDLELEYPTLPVPHHGDRAVMQEMVDNGFRGKDLAAINRVRRYLEVMFLSDITNATGRQIKECYYGDWRASKEG